MAVVEMQAVGTEHSVGSSAERWLDQNTARSVARSSAAAGIPLEEAERYRLAAGSDVVDQRAPYRSADRRSPAAERQAVVDWPLEVEHNAAGSSAGSFAVRPVAAVDTEHATVVADAELACQRPDAVAAFACPLVGAAAAGNQDVVEPVRRRPDQAAVDAVRPRDHMARTGLVGSIAVACSRRTDEPTLLAGVSRTLSVHPACRPAARPTFSSHRPSRIPA